MKVTQERLDTAFAAIEKAAAEGKRCPENGTHEVSSAVIGTLARQGKIHVAIYAGKLRVVTILVGPNAWKKTLKPGGTSLKPYRTIDKSGVKIARGNRLGRRRSTAPVTLPRLRFLETPEP